MTLAGTPAALQEPAGAGFEGDKENACRGERMDFQPSSKEQQAQQEEGPAGVAPAVPGGALEGGAGIQAASAPPAAATAAAAAVKEEEEDRSQEAPLPAPAAAVDPQPAVAAAEGPVQPLAAAPDGVKCDRSPSPAAESDPLAGDDEGPEPGANDSDFRFSEEEGEGGSRGEGEEDSDYVFSDEEEEQRRKRWLRPTPEGARRSKRIRGEGEGETAEGGPGEDGAEGFGAGEGGRERERRGQETSTAQPSRAASEDNVSEAVVSPIGLVVKRELTAEQVESELKVVQGMWEMASALDFLRHFRPQLKLSRDFGADELERVLVTSAGDGGLLADVHIDLMRGISPKSDVGPANWAVHLSNKIKYHWKPLTDGSVCPFKPEKYFEAVTYATLPAAQRVRALNFLCSIRADKEDIQERIMAAENPQPPKPAVSAAAGVPPKPPRPTRGQAPTPTPEPLEETVDSFRREPTGFDAAGNAYYFFDMSESIGFRLYRETPAELLPKPAEEAGTAAAAAGPPAEPPPSKSGRKRDRERELRRRPPPRHKQLLPDPPPAGKWELLASTLAELQSVSGRLASSPEPADRELSQVIQAKSLQLVADLQARQEAEERRIKAERRVQKKLGVDVSTEFGRARRERRNINYAFTDYDDVIRSAIKRSSRREESPEDLGPGRRRRGPSPPRYDPVLEAQRGLRRGRSAAAIHEEMPAGDLNERQLRLMARSRSTSGMSELQASYAQQLGSEQEGSEPVGAEEEEEEEEGEEEGREAGQVQQQPQHPVADADAAAQRAIEEEVPLGWDAKAVQRRPRGPRPQPAGQQAVAARAAELAQPLLLPQQPGDSSYQYQQQPQWQQPAAQPQYYQHQAPTQPLFAQQYGSSGGPVGGQALYGQPALEPQLAYGQQLQQNYGQAAPMLQQAGYGQAAGYTQQAALYGQHPAAYPEPAFGQQAAGRYGLAAQQPGYGFAQQQVYGGAPPQLALQQQYAAIQQQQYAAVQQQAQAAPQGRRGAATRQASSGRRGARKSAVYEEYAEDFEDEESEEGGEEEASDEEYDPRYG